MKINWTAAFLLAALLGCSSGDTPVQTKSASLTIDLDNANVIAIASFIDIEFVLQQLFELIREVDENFTATSGFAPFACDDSSDVSITFSGGAAVNSGDLFDIDLFDCVVGLESFDGAIQIRLDDVLANGESYLGVIEFDDFVTTNSSGNNIVTLDGNLEFGLDVNVGEAVIIIVDSDLDVTVLEDGMTIEQTTRNYKNLEFRWVPVDGNDDLILVMDVDVDFQYDDVASVEPSGTFTLETVLDIEREDGDSFPRVGEWLFCGDSGSTYELKADPLGIAVLDSTLDSDGDGGDAIQPPSPTWEALFPKRFLMPVSL